MRVDITMTANEKSGFEREVSFTALRISDVPWVLKAYLTNAAISSVVMSVVNSKTQDDKVQ